MKRLSRLIGIAALAVAPALVHAQSASSARPFSVGVSGGASLPLGDFGDAADVGFTVAGHVYFSPASLTRVGFRGDVAFDRWNYSGLGASTVDAKFRSLSVTANAILKLSTTSGLHPYLIGGAGLYNLKASASGIDSESESNGGIQVGGGLEFALSGFATFLEAKYVHVFTDGSSTQWVPITFGVRF